MIKVSYYSELICEYELKDNSVYTHEQLAGLIEEHLDLGPTMNEQVLKSTYLYMSLP